MYIVINYCFSAQRFALPALGRAAERRPIGKMLRRRKMLENAAESPASGARFVGLRAVVPDSLAWNSAFAKHLTKLLDFFDFYQYSGLFNAFTQNELPAIGATISLIND